MNLPNIPFLPIKASKAIPATVGGSTIGASTRGLITPLKRPELFARIQASGTPNNNAKLADNVELQRDNLIAEISFELSMNLDHGTAVKSAKRGAIITIAAKVAKDLVVNPNFI